MPWFGKYFYRSARVNGQPRKVYVGTGRTGELAAEADRLARLKREQEKAKADAIRKEYAALDAALNQVHKLTDALGRAALNAAGYHQHCRGDWRRRTRDRN